MANATTADFRNGMVIRYNNDVWTITEFHHVSPGNWRAFVRTRLKNLKNGRVIEQRFNAGEAIDEVRVEHQNWQFLYVDGDDYVFMNTETFDQIAGFTSRDIASDVRWCLAQLERAGIDRVLVLDLSLPAIAPW